MRKRKTIFGLCSNVLLIWLLGILLCTVGRKVSAQDQARYLVLFSDKAGTSYSVSKPEAFLSERSLKRRSRQGIPVVEADLPVNPAYVEEVLQTGAFIFYTTKWLNGVVVSATDEQLEAIKSLSFYRGLEKGRALTNPGYSAGRVSVDEENEVEPVIDYGNSKQQLEMLGIGEFHRQGITGEGILIAVMDAGFSKADEQPYLEHLFQNGQIIDTYDFISDDKNVYDDHKHGLEVLSVMASRWEGRLVGPAYDAHYALYRTENVLNETPYEEVAWLIAAERADSLGVDVINTSLGYSDFDNPEYDYRYEDMDGKTAIISKAARFAARTGMLVVVSAGNRGSDSWKYITAPADVDSVLTVGGVAASGRRYTLSSYGPNAEGVIKPDVAALGQGVSVGSTSGTVTSSSGTSFASPLVASFAALMWQVSPEKTGWQIAEAIRLSGSQATSPDTSLGYGVPFYGIGGSIATPSRFDVMLKGNLVHFTWDMVPEAVIYEIERSFDRGGFERIAATSGNSYSEDVLYDHGEYRYRIRAGTDYRFGEYSEPVTVSYVITGNEDKVRAFRVWPNPVNEILYLDLKSRLGAVRIYVVTVAGNVVQSDDVVASSNGIAEIPLGNLTAGLYLLRVVSADGVAVLKFLKQ